MRGGCLRVLFQTQKMPSYDSYPHEPLRKDVHHISTESAKSTCTRKVRHGHRLFSFYSKSELALRRQYFIFSAALQTISYLQKKI
jgi:hypothetical protein